MLRAIKYFLYLVLALFVVLLIINARAIISFGSLLKNGAVAKNNLTLTLSSIKDKDLAGATQASAQADIALEKTIISLNYLRQNYWFQKIPGLTNKLDSLSLSLEPAASSTKLLAKMLPAFSGYPDPANYLVVLENSDELRPTGGFIGTVGRLQAVNGALTIKTNDVYHLDMPASLHPEFKVDPPGPIKKYLGVDRWYLRDANWSPDWPTSARKILWFYDLEAKYSTDQDLNPPPQFSGVIAITPRVVTDLLYLTGPVTVDGQTYSKDNFVALLEAEVEMNYKDKGVSEWDRKQVIVGIMAEMEKKLLSWPSDRWPELFDTLEKNIDRKNILVYFSDNELQKISQSLGWSGEMIRPRGDYLMVVDANLAAFKSDRVMDKKFNYQVTAKPGALFSKLTATYTHNGSFDWKTTRYRDYIRVYAPIGSKLTKSSGLEDVSSWEENFQDGTIRYQVFGGYLQIEPGKKATWELNYSLPGGIYDMFAQGKYNLYWQKQPGANISQAQASWSFSKETTGGALEVDKKINLSF